MLVGYSQELRIGTNKSKLKIITPTKYLLFDIQDAQSNDKIKIEGHLKSSTVDSIKLLTYKFRADNQENSRYTYNGFNSKKAEWELTVAKSDVNFLTVYRNKEAHKRREFAVIAGAALLFSGFVTSASAFILPNDETRDPLFLLGSIEALVGFALVIPMAKKEYRFKAFGDATFVEEQ